MRKYLVILMGSLVIAAAAVPAVHAKDYNIKQMTEEVSIALENRRERYDRLTQLKASGAIGENKQGYISVLKHDPKTAELIKEENKDRKVIYQTIADQNGLADAIQVIEDVFARVQREKAAAGEMIQQNDGQWKKK